MRELRARTEHAAGLRGVGGGDCGLRPADVKAAGLSLLLPDTWDISEMNRKQAEKLLKENPDLLAAGTTVEALMGTPLSATWDGDGDTYPNRLLNLEILDERSSLPSPSDVQSQLSAFPGIEDVQAKRTTVARKPAVVATYAQHINRDDGTPTTGSASSYFFVGPHGLTLLQFIGVGVDREFESMKKTILESVRFKK